MWLFTIAAMVMIMAIIGAITRLTESGLSIAEWKPIAGALPPMSAADWTHAFDVYKASPQYLLVNHGMALSDFKKIFWWEWVHREFGRWIGVVYLAGFVWFLARGTVRRIGGNLRANLLGIFALGLVQGLMGWWMVKSGLVDNPAVSHYRLAAHLLLAVGIYVWSLGLGVYLWQSQSDSKPSAVKFPRALYRHSIAALVMVILTMTWGAFTAGLHAGLLYNTWPLMDGHFAPPGFWFLDPAWLNLFENHGDVQFVHRCLAYITGLMAISIGLMTYLRKIPKPICTWGYAVGAMGLVQPALGIATILTRVDLHAAVTHQAGAFILIGLLVIWVMQLRQIKL